LEQNRPATSYKRKGFASCVGSLEYVAKHDENERVRLFAVREIL